MYESLVLVSPPKEATCPGHHEEVQAYGQEKQRKTCSEGKLAGRTKEMQVRTRNLSTDIDGIGRRGTRSLKPTPTSAIAALAVVVSEVDQPLLTILSLVVVRAVGCKVWPFASTTSPSEKPWSTTAFEERGLRTFTATIAGADRSAAGLYEDAVDVRRPMGADLVGKDPTTDVRDVHATQSQQATLYIIVAVRCQLLTTDEQNVLLLLAPGHGGGGGVLSGDDSVVQNHSAICQYMLIVPPVSVFRLWPLTCVRARRKVEEPRED